MMNSTTQLNNVNHFAGAKGGRPPQQSAGTKAGAAQAQLNADAQAQKLKALVTAAQNGNAEALEELCILFEPLFRREMKREIFYNAIGYEEGLSLAQKNSATPLKLYILKAIPVRSLRQKKK